MADNEQYAVEVEHAVVRFNIASERIDNLKEYFIKLIKRELMFKEFLALKDVSFSVKKGESWGIIGTNGSGKSTLLKLICGILKPYKGSVKVNGKIAPMIELGAGFDGDLTASENIFLNGAVLGYDKKFMKEHFDEIVEFAELKDFLEMPIKNYSSGMAARLGFAIATVVRPDILICDEVLSVGDYAFQQKCEKRMNQMREEGTTLLYVSHSIDSVREVCDHALWLDKGVTRMNWRYRISFGSVYEKSEKLLDKKESKMRETIQNIIFPQNDMLEEHYRLYYRGVKGVLLKDGKEKKLILPEFQTIEFNTYLNGCSIEKWKKYTDLKELSLFLTMKGKFELKIYAYSLRSVEPERSLLKEAFMI